MGSIKSITNLERDIGNNYIQGKIENGSHLHQMEWFCHFHLPETECCMFQSVRLIVPVGIHLSFLESTVHRQIHYQLVIRIK